MYLDSYLDRALTWFFGVMFALIVYNHTESAKYVVFSAAIFALGGVVYNYIRDSRANK